MCRRMLHMCAATLRRTASGHGHGRTRHQGPGTWDLGHGTTDRERARNAAGVYCIWLQGSAVGAAVAVVASICGRVLKVTRTHALSMLQMPQMQSRPTASRSNATFALPLPYVQHCGAPQVVNL